MSWLSTANLPQAHDRERLAVAWTRWSEKAAKPDAPEACALLEAVFGNSPYLTETALQNPDFVTDLWRLGPDAMLADIRSLLADTRQLARTNGNAQAIAAPLRRLKRRAAFVIAVADIAGAWPLARVTAALSEIASTCLQALLDAILLQLGRDGQLAIGSAPDAAAFTVLGMGKLGADELNYSSDIDLILLYDRDAPAIRDNEQAPRHLVRAARLLVQLMSETSVDGYIFRTDLRLRPDPGSTPLAMSVQAAELYYESVGQNWERAAMIKAHPVAGNLAVGEEFLAALRPYIWRKHLDFAAIHDIHSIKRQIDAYRGSGTVKVLGHNVKLGRGGIREIEFFAQTQ
ncbi:MAG: bifunctional [glutamine synthetase] adenylyltransferase/[glutamine synthetase]-adenylyl-L-tyrosine phosphorylase, partial [Enhydrobacter sp.]